MTAIITAHSIHIVRRAQLMVVLLRKQMTAWLHSFTITITGPRTNIEPILRSITNWKYKSSHVSGQFSHRQDINMRASESLPLLLLAVSSPASTKHLGPELGRSGGRLPSLYSGSCDNSGYRCGQSAEKFFQRIPRVRGGVCTENGAQPWTVQIQVRERGRYEHRCGGSLLSDKFVLTATHCFG